MIFELPRDEFEILRQDAVEIHLYDKVVDKIYICHQATETEPKRWEFPRGSRTEIIAKLTGVKL